MADSVLTVKSKIEWQNFIGRDCKELQDGDVVECSNFSQEKERTVLACTGKKITFVKCNMKNVKLWPEMNLVDCYLVDVHAAKEADPLPVSKEEEIKERLSALSAEFGEADVKTAAIGVLKLTDSVSMKEVADGGLVR